MIDDGCIPVWVHRISYRGGRVAIGYGETPGGEAVTFATGPRALLAIAEALEYGDGPVLADVAAWSIVGRPVRDALRPRAPIVGRTADGAEQAVLAFLSGGDTSP